MALAELRIEHVRCISNANLELSPELNVIAGPNGSGKTSILEAIFLLGRGRSFRTRSTEKLIQHGQSKLIVFGRSESPECKAAGIEVSREGSRARIDGRDVDSLLALSAVLPVQALDPEIHKLIDQGPERRRRWLDWLVFHVEPTFVTHWARYQRALRQRNAAIKSGARDFGVWDAAIVGHGEAMDRARRSALARLEPYMHALMAKFAGLDLSVGLHSGWRAEDSLANALGTSTARDVERGSTTVGPHRADILLRTKGRSARETLSRGQQKLAAIAMMVSQLQLLRSELGLRATLLLDDPAAELDAQNLARMMGEIACLQCQLIATSLSPEITLFQAPKAVFHVEQGRVLQV